MTPPPFGWNGPDDDPRDGGRGPRGPRGRRGRGPRGPWDGPRPGRDFRDGLEQEIREYARRVKEEAREYQRLLEEEAREYERMMKDVAHEYQRVMDGTGPEVVDEEPEERRRRLEEEAQERRRRLHEEAQERQRRLHEEAQERQRRLHEEAENRRRRMRDHYHDRPGRPGRPGRGFRDAEHTRRNVLDAAIRSLITEGLGVSIQAIATAAGITKSGLMHHFNNRTELLVSVAEDAIEDFRNQVNDNIDLAENRPGKLLRAYIRTLFDNLEYQDSYDPAQLWSVLAPMPEITDLLIDDATRWRDDFIADGLNPDRVTVAMHAAKSFVHEAQLDPGISAESIARAKNVILALTNETGPLVDVSDTESSFDDVEEAVVEELESADDDKKSGDDSKDSSV
ncbi:TetR/AcrR family transcriptional regulator [uncultured Corynebacterium sp.]|uniref:TetR/AcrR family transcriptional regulator n=1 Tax=uncultured Corynebacterium sp. TaxID=159447 RepID=UPI0028F0A9A8|nr:TetR/AcrR family transcriptional regulator [uncultured Corynebacterium sp.]